MLHALYQNRDAWTIVEATEAPRHQGEALRADFGIAFAMPHFAAETA
jgi:UDP-3-O-[3-hydroxymyristoyl] N-acetylglucosamine deacetylase